MEMLSVQYSGGEMPGRRAGSGVGKYNAESTKQDSKRFNSQGKRNALPIWVWLINGRHPGEPRPYSIDATLYCTVGGWSEDEDGREQPDRRQDQADGNIPGQVQTVRGGSTGDANTVFLDWWSVFALFAIFENGYLPTLLPKCRKSSFFQVQSKKPSSLAARARKIFLNFF